MTIIRKVEATVYYAPTRRRRYFTLKAAIEAEASSILNKRHPSYDDDSPASWYWKYDIHRSDVLHRRLCKLLLKKHIDNQ